jgi:hypothetical protein
MQRFSHYGLLTVALVAMTWLAITFQQRLAGPTPPLPPLDQWDIPTLADHLNRAGPEVRLRPVQKNGTFSQSAFLTTTDKNWFDLNALGKDPRWIHKWRGTVYCELRGGADSADLLRLWGDQGWSAGPFLFYGDAELLDRIRAALAPLAPHAAH